MTAEQTPRPRRVDYRWRADREEGFDTATFIYGPDGKLAGVDFQTRRAQPSEEFPTEKTPDASSA